MPGMTMRMAQGVLQNEGWRVKRKEVTSEKDRWKDEIDGFY